MSSVLRPWVCDLTMMQQSVLITAVRGPDGLPKDHVAKLMLRWMRRCILYSAMDKRELLTPYDPGGGSFTGTSVAYDSPKLDCGFWQPAMDDVVSDYLRCVDEIPHHFQLHFMHAAEILGYKYPGEETRLWWNRTYRRIVNDAHLEPESEARMDFRLGDNREQWLASEEVTAANPMPVFAAPLPTR
jgi:hypothetical protein